MTAEIMRRMLQVGLGRFERTDGAANRRMMFSVVGCCRGGVGLLRENRRQRERRNARDGQAGNEDG
jgi:hypothetical protein